MPVGRCRNTQTSKIFAARFIFLARGLAANYAVWILTGCIDRTECYGGQDGRILEVAA